MKPDSHHPEMVDFRAESKMAALTLSRTLRFKLTIRLIFTHV